jgi:subtilisin family serine protease
MSRRREFDWLVSAVISLVAGSGVGSMARGEDKLFLADTRGRRPVQGNQPARLSAALYATLDARGTLQGADSSGRAVIAVPEPNAPSFRNSPVIRELTAPPADWDTVQQLKLSYGPEGPMSEQALQDLGLKLIEDYSKGSFQVVEPIEMKIDAALVSRLEREPRVKFATPALRMQAIPKRERRAPLPGLLPGDEKAVPAATNDALWSALWNMRSLHADVAWKTIRESPSVVVAVLDTGVDYNHEDLRDNMWKDADGKYGFDFVGDDHNPMDLNGHGTHCAGTIGAVGNNGVGVAGVTWKVKIMAVRWLDAKGVGDVINAIKSIDYAVEHGAKILSCSWYWHEDDPDLESAIKRAMAAKILLVAAAGNLAEEKDNNRGDNDKVETKGRFPSAYRLDNIVAVAAIDQSEQLASFSEFGRRTVHLAAPGDSITSTILNNAYNGDFRGTSMAVPHVSGALALTMAANPALEPIAVKQLLLSHVRKLPALKGKCISEGTLDLSFLGKQSVSE